MDRRLVLLKRTVEIDGAGAPVDIWREDGVAWAERVAVTGSETDAAGTTRSAVSSTYRIRYRPDLAAPEASGVFRVRIDGRDHDIKSALEDESQPRRSALLLTLSYSQGDKTLKALP